MPAAIQLREIGHFYSKGLLCSQLFPAVPVLNAIPTAPRRSFFAEKNLNMWFRRRNSITISNSDIPPAHIAPVNSVTTKVAPARGGPTKLIKSRPTVPKQNNSSIVDITWPLQRSSNYEEMLFSPMVGNEEPQHAETSILQDYWGYTPSFCSTISTPIPGRLESSLPLPPPPPVPHFSRPKATSPTIISSPQGLENIVPPSIERVYASPPNSPLPDISASPSFRTDSPYYSSQKYVSDPLSTSRNRRPSLEQFERPVSPVSPVFSGSDVTSTSTHIFSRRRFPIPLAMANSTRTTPLHVREQSLPTIASSGKLPPESFPSPKHTRQPSQAPSTKFNPNPPNELARNRSLRRSVEISSGCPRGSIQPSRNHYHFTAYWTPPGTPPGHAASSIPKSPRIPSTQMVHQRAISSPTKNLANNSSSQAFGGSVLSDNAHIRKQSSASSISIAIDTADEDSIPVLGKAIEEAISRPSLSSDCTSASLRSHSVSPMTSTLSTTDASTVMPRPPSPANSARPTSPTCSVRPVSPTQFVITSTPRQPSPVPSVRTAKTGYSIPEGQLHSPQLPSTFSHSSDLSGLLMSTTKNTTTTKTSSMPTAASKLPPGNMPTFPSRHEAKKARKAYLAAQAEAKRQSAKMGVEGILGWDAGKRAWVCKMTDEEKKAWLEKMTAGKGASVTDKRSDGKDSWGRGVTISMGRGKDGAAVGFSGLGVKVVDVGGR